MNNEELLALYLEKLHLMSQEKLTHSNMSVIEALKASLIYLEGEYKGIK